MVEKQLITKACGLYKSTYKVAGLLQANQSTMASAADEVSRARKGKLYKANGIV